MEVSITQVLKVVLHTKPKVMIELNRCVVLNGMLKSVYVEYIQCF